MALLPSMDRPEASNAASNVPASGAGQPAPQPGQNGTETNKSGVHLRDVGNSLRSIGKLSRSVAERLDVAVGRIEQINLQTKLLSLNAQVEASRAGAAGKAFGVVASEMVGLSEKTSGAANQLDTETRTDIDNLSKEIDQLGASIRGTRLMDLAYNNIDLIDRNLYERSCDVRWWATDGSIVDALQNPSEEKQRYAGERLGTILDSYTVYYDIVLCDIKGQVVASGRPQQYYCLGTSQWEQSWFKQAASSMDGTCFGFQSVHRSSTLASGKFILVYSCAVRRDGKPHGDVLGVLGIVFNWENLGQTVVNRTPISEDEKKFTRAAIVNEAGLVLADTSNSILEETIKFAELKDTKALNKGFFVTIYEEEPLIIAHAHSQGFETYATGWDSYIVQKLHI